MAQPATSAVLGRPLGPGLGAAVAHRPDPLGHFGDWGGRFVPEVLMAALDQLNDAFEDAITDPAFIAELDALRRDYAGRPTPLFCARRLSEELGLRVWLKREDLLHTGAHKLNNSLGQHLLTRRMGKPRVIAETGAGQHGVATATVAALLGQECVVYMGEEDTRRQHLNVVRMRLLGTEVRSVATGTATLKDAINEALRDWVESVGSTHYAIGSVVGPHPFPLMVREFQRVIGDEARAQILAAEGRLPDLAVACVGGGSNAAGLFAGFVDDEPVRLVGVEAGGRGPDRATTAPPWGWARPGCSTGPAPTSSRTPTARSCPPTRSRPASTTQGSVPSTPSGRTPAGSPTSGPPTPSPSTASACSPGPRACCPPSSPPTPSAGSPWRPARGGSLPAPWSCSTCRAAATRTSRPWPGCWSTTRPPPDPTDA